MFIRTVHRSSLQSAALLAAIAGAGAALLVWPDAAAGGVSRGLSICATVLIPSLFPFLVLAGFLVRSGLSRKLGQRLEKPVQWLFGLPGCCAAGIVVSLVGGYPSGGVAVGELLRQGDIIPAQAKRMLRFCVNGGPAFIISAVGAGMMGHVRFGLVLFAVHIGVALLLGIGQRFWLGYRAASPPASAKPADAVPVSAAFVDAVSAACRSLLYMCGFVVLFATALALLDASGVAGLVQYLLTRPVAWLGGDTTALPELLPGLLEVSCGCVEAAGSGAAAPFLLGFFLGWGGLSVHCQLAASLREWRLIDGAFFRARLLHGLLAGAGSWLLFRVVPMPLTVFAPLQDAVIATGATSATASFALLLMASLLLLTGKKSGKAG